MVRIPKFTFYRANRFDDVIASQRIVYLHTANPHLMKIAEQDRELLAAAELPLLVPDAWSLDYPFRKSEAGSKINKY